MIYHMRETARKKGEENTHEKADRIHTAGGHDDRHAAAAGAGGHGVGGGCFSDHGTGQGVHLRLSEFQKRKQCIKRLLERLTVLHEGYVICAKKTGHGDPEEPRRPEKLSGGSYYHTVQGSKQ